jgi:hypothetical protein
MAIEDDALAHVTGGAGPPLPLVRAAPHEYGLYTTWGSKTPGRPPPPIGDPSGIRFTFWGRPARDAVILSGPQLEEPEPQRP